MAEAEDVTQLVGIGGGQADLAGHGRVFMLAVALTPNAVEGEVLAGQPGMLGGNDPAPGIVPGVDGIFSDRRPGLPPQI